jgi:hypothetical protein
MMMMMYFVKALSEVLTGVEIEPNSSVLANLSELPHNNQIVDQSSHRAIDQNDGSIRQKDEVIEQPSHSAIQATGPLNRKGSDAHPDDIFQELQDMSQMRHQDVQPNNNHNDETEESDNEFNFEDIRL